MYLILVAVLLGFCMCIAIAVLVIMSSGDEEGGNAGSDGEVLDNAPVYPIPDDAVRSKSLDDFGYQTDSLVYPKGKGDEIKNITDAGNGIIKFELRNRGSWYDGDRDLRNNSKGLDKARAEISGLINYKQKEGQTWEYGTTVRTAEDFRPASGYCNLMQTFPITFTSLVKLQGEVITGRLYYVTANIGHHPHAVAREFTFKRGEWITLAIRLKIHATDGECMLSVNGDAFKGVKGVKMIKMDADEYSPTWGLYSSATKDVNGKPLGDNIVYHKNVWLRKVS